MNESGNLINKKVKTVSNLDGGIYIIPESEVNSDLNATVIQDDVLDLSNFNTENISNFSSRFKGIKVNKVIWRENFKTVNVENVTSMFAETEMNLVDFRKFGNFVFYSNVKMSDALYGSTIGNLKVANQEMADSFSSRENGSGVTIKVAP